MSPRAPKVAQEPPWFQHEYPRHPQIGMNHPELILVPWTVFAIALALKVLKFGKALKRHLIAPTSSSEQFRQILERIWEQEAQKEAKWRP